MPKSWIIPKKQIEDTGFLAEIYKSHDERFLFSVFYDKIRIEYFAYICF